MKHWSYWSHFHIYLLYLVPELLDEIERFKPKMAVQRFLIILQKSSQIQYFKTKMYIIKIYCIMLISVSYHTLLIFYVAFLTLNNCFIASGKRCIQINQHLHMYEMPFSETELFKIVWILLTSSFL